MSVLSQNHTLGEHLSSKVSCFLEKFHVGKILKACNAYKVRGFSVSNVFQVAFENVFHNKSFYQQKNMNPSFIPFAKDTFYRLMNSSCINWRKFTLQLGKAVIQKIVPLTSESRRNVLIIVSGKPSGVTVFLNFFIPGKERIQLFRTDLEINEGYLTRIDESDSRK